MKQTSQKSIINLYGSYNEGDKEKMENTKYEDLKKMMQHICKQKDINIKDLLIYCIFSEYPISTIDEEHRTTEECIKELKEDYDTLWSIQPTLEDNEEVAFAIQHARDIYDVLLDRADY